MNNQEATVKIVEAIIARTAELGINSVSAMGKVAADLYQEVFAAVSGSASQGPPRTNR